MMRTALHRLATLVMGVGCGLAAWRAIVQAAEPPSPAEAEARALTFLEREVPLWSRENKCYSCHNNGDAARALFAAAGQGRPIPRPALADTIRWLTRPDDWDHNGGEGPFSDKRLARIEFTSALADAIQTHQLDDVGPLRRAAERLAADQAPDGSWPLEGGDLLGSPATYGRPLATLMASEALSRADPVRYQKAIDSARRWLLAHEVRNVMDAAVVLWTCGPTGPAAIRQRCLDFLRPAQSSDGGWGPYPASPPEPFDTALVLIALIRSHPRPDPEIRGQIRRGREFLASIQQDDGSWPETTRPAGAVSYAQRLSTTGWATLALVATRDP
jgi:hypothetical protein